AVHVADGARQALVTIYSPTVVIASMFASRTELVAVISLVIILLLLTPFAMRGSRWVRFLAYLLAAVMIVRGLGFVVMFGRVGSTSHFVPVMPGFYSSFLLLAASVFLLYQLRSLTRSAPKPGSARGPSAER